MIDHSKWSAADHWRWLMDSNEANHLRRIARKCALRKDHYSAAALRGVAGAFEADMLRLERKERRK